MYVGMSLWPDIVLSLMHCTMLVGDPEMADGLNEDPHTLLSKTLFGSPLHNGIYSSFRACHAIVTKFWLDLYQSKRLGTQHICSEELLACLVLSLGKQRGKREVSVTSFEKNCPGRQ